MTADPTPTLDSGDAATPHPPSSASGAQRLKPGGPAQARDVVVFGREVGRVLSDGRIVGRAEPFAKVFASSRDVKRAVGATAWVILEDIALDATIDAQGRLVADTSVRQIAANLGLNKPIVARHVARLRDYGFVLHEEARDEASLTHTSVAEQPPVQSSPELDDRNDGAEATVSASTGHGGTGHGETGRLVRHRHAVEEEQHAQDPGDDDENAAALIRRLRAEGVAANVAEDLVARFPALQIADALDVLPARRCSNAAGWLVRAISDGWQLHDEAQRLRAARTDVQQRHNDALATQVRQEQREAWLTGWGAAVSDALTDTQLAAAVHRVTRPVAALDRRSAPVAASQLLAWAITTATSAPYEPLDTALNNALHEHTSDPEIALVELPDDIPPAPATNATADPDAFRRRVRHAINDLEASHPSLKPRLEGGSDAP